MKKAKFKTGDKVRVKETPELRSWDEWKKCVGKVLTIDPVAGGGKREPGGIYLCQKNKYCINFTEAMLELEETKMIYKYGLQDDDDETLTLYKTMKDLKEDMTANAEGDIDYTAYELVPVLKAKVEWKVEFINLKK